MFGSELHKWYTATTTRSLRRKHRHTPGCAVFLRNREVDVTTSTTCAISFQPPERFRRGQAQIARDTLVIRTAIITRWPGFNPSSLESDKPHVCVCSPWCVAANASIQHACSRKQTLLRQPGLPQLGHTTELLCCRVSKLFDHVMGDSTSPEFPRNDSHGPTSSQSCSWFVGAFTQHLENPRSVTKEENGKRSSNRILRAYTT